MSALTTEAQFREKSALNGIRSSIGLKALMAVSGLIWFGFLVAHLVTNLHAFGGPSSLNDYYAGLKANPLLLWGVRALLTGSILVHVVAAFLLVRRNWRARSTRYHATPSLSENYASRTMRWTGPILLLFILYHLLHFTVGVMPGGTTYNPGDDYSNIVQSFSLWYISLSYILAMGALSTHLWHGIWSASRSLGGSHPKWDGAARVIAHGVTALLVAGFISLPLAVLTGFLR